MRFKTYTYIYAPDGGRQRVKEFRYCILWKYIYKYIYKMCLEDNVSKPVLFSLVCCVLAHIYIIVKNWGESNITIIYTYRYVYVGTHIYGYGIMCVAQ